ncbi:hypothetical protein SAMN06264365_12459 [Actinoplanes regularis]|uniref:NHLP leader peptide domain-containing protein n=1 Tax=Actinoplanes regularis TaxID=52697 RepID=A0A239HE51_9ACTN|nr:hypothetical protein Are01nite_75000 [Actinoplanes regularis]SNS79699.1 hypothetical protein SAMN06264365_12459 [Actinoplanes regularis]
MKVTAEWKEKGVTNGERAAFVAAYSRLVAEVWADAAAERALAENPRDLLAEYGLTVPEHVHIAVVRDANDAQPDLDTQVTAWENAGQLGTFTLYVPATGPIGEAELEEDELDRVVGGLDASCACCCPCCSTT